METVGLFGLIILVAVFLLQTRGIFRGKDLYFYGLNAVGAGLLSYYAISIANVYFAVLESIWCVGAFISLGTIWIKRTNHRNTQKFN
jgi:hypothetical protein